MRHAPETRVGPYILRERIGAGGMGQVFRAEHVETGAVHALKVMGGVVGAEEQLRFVREAEALARVDGHPHVLRVHAAGVDGGGPWLAMELAEGGSLADRLRAGPLAPDEAILLVHDLARGLAHVHARGVLHRDLKPENVLFAADGAPRLADFGLARLHDARSLPETGSVLGTPAYMSPEQARGERGLDERTDVYGLGAVLYHALTGRPPVAGDAALHELLARAARGTFPPPRALRPELPPWLEAVCLRAMSTSPADRYASAAALADALAARRAVPRPWSRAAAITAAITIALVGAAALAARRSTSTELPATTREPEPPPPPEPAPVDASASRREPTIRDVEQLLDRGEASEALELLVAMSRPDAALLRVEAHLARDELTRAAAAVPPEHTDLRELLDLLARFEEPRPRDGKQIGPLFLAMGGLNALPERARLVRALGRSLQRLTCRPDVLAAFDEGSANFLVPALRQGVGLDPHSPWGRDLAVLAGLTEGTSLAPRDDAPEHVRALARLARDRATSKAARRAATRHAPPDEAELAERPPPALLELAQGKVLGDVVRDGCARRVKDLVHVAFVWRAREATRVAALAAARAWLAVIDEDRKDLVHAEVALFAGARDDARRALADAGHGLGARELYLAELALQAGEAERALARLDPLVASCEADLRPDDRGNDAGVLVLLDYWSARAVARALRGDLAGAEADVARARELAANPAFPVRLPWRRPDPTAEVVARIRAGDPAWTGSAPPPAEW